MRKEEFERRAAEMRARRFTPVATQTAPVKQPDRRRARSLAPNAPILNIVDLPTASRYGLLREVWKPSHTKSLIVALGEVHPLVIRAARGIATQQVGYDGLIYLRGNGMLDIAASTRMLPEALRLFDLLLRTLAEAGGSVSVTNETTINLQGETFKIRLREASERRPKPAGSPGYRDSEYFPTGQLWLKGAHDHGSNIRTAAGDVEGFLDKIRRFINRLPRLRQQRMEREREREEEWARRRAEWQAQEDQRRQWNEQQARFNEVTSDVEQWLKAEHLRAYATACEAHQITTRGCIDAGGSIDAWLRWIHWYANHLDPITRPDGPKQGPED